MMSDKSEIPPVPFPFLMVPRSLLPNGPLQAILAVLLDQYSHPSPPGRALARFCHCSESGIRKAKAILVRKGILDEYMELAEEHRSQTHFLAVAEKLLPQVSPLAALLHALMHERVRLDRPQRGAIAMALEFHVGEREVLQALEELRKAG